VRAIVEEAEATSEQRALDEVNSSSYVFDTAEVLSRLPLLPRRSKGELYLTDVIGMLVEDGLMVAAYEAEESEALGINTPEQLAEAQARAAREGHHS
jgi:bifunctional UDP-N-acetylglucosamine pyrophosphorylase/glucosamine-1-phosphate N-acetyltransferase